jgi:hypothetical protein
MLQIVCVATCVCRHRVHQYAATLVVAGEYVEDTEEYINIELDSSRNRLIKLEVVLTAGTFSLAVFTLVGGECSPIGQGLAVSAASEHAQLHTTAQTL